MYSTLVDILDRIRHIFWPEKYQYSNNIEKSMLILLLCFPSSPIKSLCFRIQKMMEVYKPDWCETREEWSVYMFSPQNKWVQHRFRCKFKSNDRVVCMCCQTSVGHADPTLSWWRVFFSFLYLNWEKKSPRMNFFKWLYNSKHSVCGLWNVQPFSERHTKRQACLLMCQYL